MDDGLMPGPLNVLVIEDVVSDFLLLERHLREQDLDARCRRVEGADELSAALEEAGWHVVLSDYRVPGMDFREALEQIRARAPDLPVILVSGSVGEEEAVELLKQGVWDFVLKDRLARLGPAIQRTLLEVDERHAREEAERALRESEKRYRSFLEEVPIGIYRTTPDGRILLANPAIVKMLGYDSLEELCLRNLEQFDFEPEYSRRNFKETMEREGEIRGLETTWRRKDGSFSHVRETARAVRGPDGAVLYYDGTVEDVSERKRAEDALRESEARHRFLFENMLEGYAYCRMLYEDGKPVDFGYLHVNEAFERLTGLKGVVGKKVTEVIPGIRESNPELFETYGRVASTGRAEQFETFVEPLRIWFAISVYCPEKGCFVAVFDNITKRRSLEEQLRQSQKMEAVGQLAGGVAHDFNNLLTVISGNSDLLLGRMAAHDPLRANVADIRHAGERAAALTRQLLAFSRKQILEPKILDLNDVIAGTEKMLQRLIGEDIVLTFIPASDLSRVKVDPGQMEQVILNIAVNARDAMPQGGRLTIETRNVEGAALSSDTVPAKTAPSVLLAISDTGCGMTPEVVSRIFEPFFTTKGPGKGTGLGLATVYGIVQQSEGRIDVKSATGAGTTFEILLPACEEAPGARLGSDARLRAVPHGSETILLVEDEEAVRRIVKLVLESSGYKVLEARDGPEALEVAGSHDGAIHLLITDVVMPQMSGREVAECLRSRAPSLSVLFISGYTDDAVMRHGITETGEAFLQKPFSPLSLAKKVREVLDRGA